jgi:hypothetical protein
MVAAAGALALSCGCPVEPLPPFTLLQANVGNTLLACDEGYVFKLCERAVEEAIRDRIAALEPDVIAFQEILPDDACARPALAAEDDARFVCHPEHLETTGEPSQMRRLLGDGYQWVCDARNGYECVAVRRGVGSIEADYRVLEPVESDADEACDPGFSVGTVALAIGDVAFTLVNGHPQSGFLGVCREKQVRQAFAAAPAGASLLSGDWNLDPFGALDDPSVDAWLEEVGDAGEGKRFRYHSGSAERRPPYPTTANALFTGVLDHVASDFLAGSCLTLGEAPATERLDGGAGTDHRALSCSLTPRAR